MTYEEFQTEVRRLSDEVDMAERRLAAAAPVMAWDPLKSDWFAARAALRDFRAAAPSDYRRRAGGARYNRYVRPFSCG